nr:hypothetical protein CFP56_39680 [Quercus suber]
MPRWIVKDCSPDAFQIMPRVPPQRSSHCLHFLTHHFTDPSSANPRRRVTVTQCFTRQPPSSFSAFSSEVRRWHMNHKRWMTIVKAMAMLEHQQAQRPKGMY